MWEFLSLTFWDSCYNNDLLELRVVADQRSLKCIVSVDLNRLDYSVVWFI